MNPKILEKSFLLLFIFFLNYCGSDNKDAKSNAQIPPHEQKLQSYFSENNRGKWNDLPDEHCPNVNIIKSKKDISIVVFPPFSGTPGHYVETFLLTDYALKEIQKTTFPRGTTAANTLFSLPLNSKGEFYIILKCNLHDMWYKKILIN